MASTDYAQITKTTQDQFFGALSAVQDTIVENYAKVTETAAKLVPARVQTATKDLPVGPQQVVGLGFDFAAKLVDTQRTFAEKLLAAAAPAPAQTSSNKATGKSSK